MSKALSSACLVLWICLGGSAWAGKPRIAVLGLEAAPGASGAVEPETTQVAQNITRELRQRAQASASPYIVAPNSNKDLTDEKLLMSCDNEAASCMVVIGAGLAADVLLYGRVERKGEIFRISLKLLDVKAKTIESAGDELPVGGSVTNVSKRLFGKLSGEIPSIVGTLVVKVRSKSGGEIENGAVVVDEERKGELASGRLTVTGIAEGRHKVAIEAGGYRRFEQTVTIRAGEQASLDALLIEKRTPSSSSPPASSPSSSSSVFENPLLWKVSLGAGAGVAVAGGLLSLYSFNRANSQFADNSVKVMGDAGAIVASGKCGKSQQEILETSNPKVTSFDYAAFQEGCTWKTRIYIGLAVAGVGGAAAILSLIMLSRESGPSEKSATSARSKKPEVAIVPLLATDGAGASFSLTW
jgi:hypothetical protein